MYSKNSATWGTFLKVSSNIVRKIEIFDSFEVQTERIS